MATCSQEDGAYWLWDQADRCGLHGFSREALRRLWHNSTIYLAGDSHVRYVYNAISRVFDGEWSLCSAYNACSVLPQNA